MLYDYIKESNSRFPEEIMELSNFKDMDETVADIIFEIYKEQENNNYEKVTQLLEQNKTLLKPYIINSHTLNRLAEELYNTQVFAFTNLQQIVISPNEPSVVMRKNDFWEQDYS